VNRFQAAQDADGFLHGTRDEVLDLLRRRVGEIGLDRDGLGMAFLFVEHHERSESLD
jgi:hypothetical protein